MRSLSIFLCLMYNVYCIPSFSSTDAFMCTVYQVSVQLMHSCVLYTKFQFNWCIHVYCIPSFSSTDEIMCTVYTKFQFNWCIHVYCTPSFSSTDAFMCTVYQVSVQLMHSCVLYTKFQFNWCIRVYCIHQVSVQLMLPYVLYTTYFYDNDIRSLDIKMKNFYLEKSDNAWTCNRNIMLAYHTWRILEQFMSLNLFHSYRSL